MSFSLGLKQEILENRPMRVRCKQAQSYGLFLFSRSFTADQVMLRTENEETSSCSSGSRGISWAGKRPLPRKRSGGAASPCIPSPWP